MSQYKPEILFLKQEDVIKAGLLDMKMILEVTEKTFKMIGEGQVINPTKVFMGMPDNENWTSYCMSMPAYLGGDIDIAGFKWAAESVFNATQPGMPYGVDIVTLSDPKTVYPKAIMDGTAKAEIMYLTIANGCITVDWNPDVEIPADVKAAVEQTMEDIKSGKIDVPNEYEQDQAAELLASYK